MSTTNQLPPADKAKHDAEEVLAEADEQIANVRSVYESTLRSKEVPEKVQRKIKNALENQRSALEFIAFGFTQAFGKPGTKFTAFPVAANASDFPALFKKNMPGVADARPDIMQTIERHEPFPSRPQWLAHLVTLTNENKHRVLTAQTRDETRWIEVNTPGVRGIGFQLAGPGKAGISFPGGRVFINGVEVDRGTLQPLGGQRKPYTETVYVDWLFADPPVSALGTLERIQQGVRALVAEVCHVAGL